MLTSPSTCGIVEEQWKWSVVMVVVVVVLIALAIASFTVATDPTLPHRH